MENPPPGLTFIEEKDWLSHLKGNGASIRVGFDPHSTTAWTRAALKGAGTTPVETESPLTRMKSKKTPQELRHMILSFERADQVVQQAQLWLCRQVEKGKKVSEADFADRVEHLFGRSGAWGLSFKVISAAGKNGAIIHYSNPDSKRFIKEGELMLLDTGAYYEGGLCNGSHKNLLGWGKRGSANS